MSVLTNALFCSSNVRFMSNITNIHKDFHFCQNIENETLRLGAGLLPIVVFEYFDKSESSRECW
jgi:hypothetical protein